MPVINCNEVLPAADINPGTVGVDKGEVLLGGLACHGQSSQDKERAGHTVAKGVHSLIRGHS